MTTKYINASACKHYKLVNVWDLPLNLIPRLWNSPILTAVRSLFGGLHLQTLLCCSWKCELPSVVYCSVVALYSLSGHCGPFRHQMPVTAFSPNCSNIVTPFHFSWLHSFLISILKSCSTRLICREHVFDYTSAISDFSSVLQQVC